MTKMKPKLDVNTLLWCADYAEKRFLAKVLCYAEDQLLMAEFAQYLRKKASKQKKTEKTK